jgi:hypothetical protein
LGRHIAKGAELFPDPATKPRLGEALIEQYRKGKVDEALRAFKKLYLEVVHRSLIILRLRNAAKRAKDRTLCECRDELSSIAKQSANYGCYGPNSVMAAGYQL